MENVLKFPEVYATKKAFVNPVTRFINNYKIRQERRYRFKVEALRQATYNYFMEQLQKIKTNGVELPIFVTAKNMANEEIRKAEAKGKKHIELCYKELIKSAKK